MSRPPYFHSEREAEVAASNDIEQAKRRIKEISDLLPTVTGAPREGLLQELKKFHEFGEIYEYFCYDDENRDCSAYIILSDRDSVYWTARGVPCTYKANPVPDLAKKVLEVLEVEKSVDNK